MKAKQIKNFMNKIKQSRNCWVWTSTKDKSGYGRFKLNYKMVSAHRLSYELFKCEIPIGLDLDHLCCNKSCVNPDHLEAVTTKENIRRGNTGKYIHLFQKLKTHCKRGHEYSQKNTYLYKKIRHCMECNRIRSRNYRLEKKKIKNE